MKKLNLENYFVKINTKEGKKDIPYDVKTSLKNVLFDIRQRLDHIQLFEVMDVWKKIENEEIEVILEDSEFNIIIRSLNLFKGWSENDYEFVKRIKEVESFEIK